MNSAEYWEALTTAIVTWAVAAVFIERGLYQVFDTNLWRRFHDWFEEAFIIDLKPFVSACVSIYVCFLYQFDLFQVAFQYTGPHYTTVFLSGLGVAGGTTGAFKALRRLRKIKDAQAAQRINGNGT